MESKQVKVRSELQELKVLIIVSFVALIVLVAVATNYYFSLSGHEISRLTRLNQHVTVDNLR